jgi:hypothetical protein
LSNSLFPHEVIAAIKYKNRILYTTRLGASFANGEKTIVLVQVARESTDEKVHTKKLLSSFNKEIQVLF